MSKDTAASIRARLLAVAKAQNTDFDQLLVRFALERMLYRLGVSPYAQRFLLKGALLFAMWYDMPHRPTRDADLLGFGASDHAAIKEVFREIASIAVDDGIVFSAEHIDVAEIRKSAGYTGVRVVFGAQLSGARCKVQIDIGFGDAVTPEPVEAAYPTLLADLPAPKLRTYPVYTVVAEKLHAIVLLGMVNTRLKDYYDISVILQRETLNYGVLAMAIAATFERRGTAVPQDLPIGLSEEFASDAQKQLQWKAFLSKNGLPLMPLGQCVASLGDMYAKINYYYKNSKL